MNLIPCGLKTLVKLPQQFRCRSCTQKRFDFNFFIPRSSSSVLQRKISAISKMPESSSKKLRGTPKPHTAMDEVSTDGAFVRTGTVFRNKISTEPGSKFPPEKDRYHLYVSYACPWASRCLAVRALKGLEDVISLSVVGAVLTKTKPEDPADTHRGWVFVKEEDEPGAIPDTVMKAKTIRDIYEMNNDTLGKYTVPILFDKKQRVIVNNESAEIIRMFNSEFNGLARNPEMDLYPEHLREKIEKTNEWVYFHINDGVYKCGFSQKQKAYDDAVKELFEYLEKAEEILSNQRYLTSDTQITEADIRFFVTIVRFDEVYHGHFKCNKKRISDYPAMTGYMREIYQLPGMAETVNMTHIKEHYHRSHPTINPFGIVPAGPNTLETLVLPHGRDKM